MQVSDEYCERKEVCEETDCLTDGNVLYVRTRNLYQTYLPLGCQKLCVQIIGRTGAATSFSRGFKNFQLTPTLSEEIHEYLSLLNSDLERSL